MNRRESLKAMGITTVSTGILLDACKTEADKPLQLAKETGDTERTGCRNLKKND